VSDSNGRGLFDTVGFKLAEGKGLREGWHSKELWKSVEKLKVSVLDSEMMEAPIYPVSYASFERPDIQSRIVFSIECFDMLERSTKWSPSCLCKFTICAAFGGETCSHLSLAASRNIPASLCSFRASSNSPIHRLMYP